MQHRALLRMAAAIGLKASVGTLGWVGTARGFGWMTGSCLAGGLLDRTSRAGGRLGSHGLVTGSIIVGSKSAITPKEYLDFKFTPWSASSRSSCKTAASGRS